MGGRRAGDSVKEKGSPIMRRPRFEVRAGRSLRIEEPPMPRGEMDDGSRHGRRGCREEGW